MTGAVGRIGVAPWLRLDGELVYFCIHGREERPRGILAILVGVEHVEGVIARPRPRQ